MERLETARRFALGITVWLRNNFTVVGVVGCLVGAWALSYWSIWWVTPLVGLGLALFYGVYGAVNEESYWAALLHLSCFAVGHVSALHYEGWLSVGYSAVLAVVELTVLMCIYVCTWEGLKYSSLREERKKGTA